MTIRMFGLVINVRKQSTYKVAKIDNALREKSFREVSDSDEYRVLREKAVALRANRR